MDVLEDDTPLTDTFHSNLYEISNAQVKTFTFNVKGASLLILAENFLSIKVEDNS